MPIRVPLLVVGGGIGGLATALSAARHGLPAHVLERSPEFAELGAGLQLAPNATRMLDRLGILDAVSAHAIFPRALIMMDAVAGTRLSTLDLGTRFRERFEYPYLVMHRGDLLEAELEACRAHPEITLERNREVVDVENAGDGVRVRCADGTEYDCDALVGADGLRSVVRRVVHDDGPPVCSQYVAYRGTVPFSDLPDGADPENMTIWVGPGLHFVQYVVRAGALFNQVAVLRSDRFQPGHELLDDWGTVSEMEERYATVCPRVRSGLDRIGRFRRWPMFDRLPIPRWTNGRITILGDAAHPMLQYIAQGACQALEDAVCLGDALDRHRADVDAAFAEYAAARLPRAARVQRWARFFGELKHLDGAAAQIRNALLARRSPHDYEYFDWLYGGGYR